LKGFDVQDPEEIKFGHPMPRDEVIKPRDVPEGEDPVDYKRLVYPPRSVHGYTTLNSLPYEVEIVGIVAGERARYQIPAGSDPARNRFGLWLARDYILIERKPDWIASDQAYIPFHFVVNCNQFALTANRGSVGNTPREVMEAVEKTVREYLSTEVYESKKYLDWEEARFEAQIRRKRSKQHEKIDKRTKTLQKRTLLHLPGSIEFTPRNEAETVLLLGSLIATNVNLIPVVIADAETQIGIDLLVRLYNSATRKLEYRAFEVEYKLSSFFAHKHGLDQVNGVVCWTDEGYSDGTAIEYEGKKVKYSVSQPNDGISTKGLAFDGTWIPIYVLADIVNFVRENPSAAKEWPRPFHCESCNKDLKMPLIDFVHHVNGH